MSKITELIWWRKSVMFYLKDKLNLTDEEALEVDIELFDNDFQTIHKIIEEEEYSHQRAGLDG